MNDNLTPKAQNVLTNAKTIAQKLGHTYIGSEHLLLALSSEEKSLSKKILDDKGLTYSFLLDYVREMSGYGEETHLSASDMTPRLKKIISLSKTNDIYNDDMIGTEHLLYSLLECKDCVAYKIVSRAGTNIPDIKNNTQKYSIPKEKADESLSSKKNGNQSKLKDCPTLLAYGKNMTGENVSEYDPVIGRERETERIIQILSRKTKNNPALVGEPGVGKTAVVEGLAKRISDGNVPEELRNKIVVSLDVSSMIAGAKYRGEFEERLKNAIQETTKNKNIILFIDELHIIVGAGAAEGALDAANILKPALSRGELQLIGATTIDEYRKHIEKDAALERRFQPVYIEEPTIEETKRILFGLRHKYESHHKMTITDEAIVCACELSAKYINDRFLPDKALDLLDEAASKKRIRAYTVPQSIKNAERKIIDAEKSKEIAITSQSFEDAALIRDNVSEMKNDFKYMYDEWKKSVNQSSLTLEADDICDILCQWTGIPTSELKEKESKKLAQLESELNSHIIGQNEAVKAIANAIKRGRCGLKPNDKPIGSFLFIGPTGVGKTELAKVLAKCVFGSESSIIKLDMSEYKEPHSISKLIGSPPGYVGYEDGGKLCDKVRRKPYSIVLFDEIEKAHPDIFNLLLQILDEGILTDSGGRRVNFKNTIIIMTSNAGAKEAYSQKTIGFASSEKKDEAKRCFIKNATKIFNDEFINRIDSVVYFSSLTDDNLKDISRKMIADLKRRSAEIGINIETSDSIYDVIIDEDRERRFGARPLKRSIINNIEIPISDMIVRGGVTKGDTVYIFSEKNNDNKISFTIKK